jgi:plasmid stabilization system protein ParE
MKVLYSEGVFEELVEISYHLATKDDHIAQKFLDACDATFKMLATNPFAGFARSSEKPELAGVRLFPIRGFSVFLIAYVPINDGVRILHVISGSTDYQARFGLD